jgi:hypothetical protein
MTEPLSISAAFTSVKTALEIAKLIRDGSNSLERAELNLRLADLVSSLADAKIELTCLQDELSAKDARIAELQAAFERRDKVTRAGDAMYTVGAGGGAIGEPYCIRCWEADQRLRPLVVSFKHGMQTHCHFCDRSFNGHTTKTLEAEIHRK